MKAILTKFLGATNFRSSRIKATDTDGNSITTPWDDELGPEENHLLAATKLCTKMNWKGDLVTGTLKNEYVHVFKN